MEGRRLLRKDMWMGVSSYGSLTVAWLCDLHDLSELQSSSKIEGDGTVFQALKGRVCGAVDDAFGACSSESRLEYTIGPLYFWDSTLGADCSLNTCCVKP